jgi:hypothetical protein
VPRDGATILSDLRYPTLTIVCAPCGRRGRYNVDRLMAEHGDAKLTDLLATLADCPKARSASVYDRCKGSVRWARLRQRVMSNLLGAMPRRPQAMNQRRLPLRRQKLPLRVHPCRQVPFGGSGIASCAPCDGTPNDPDDV